MTSLPQRPPSVVELLVFRAGGFCLGVESGRIASILTLAEAEEKGLTLIDPHDVLGLPPQRRSSASRVMVLKGGRSTGVVIEGPDEFILAEATEISPLPPLVAATISIPAIRGVAVRGDRFIVLADFARGARPDGADPAV